MITPTSGGRTPPPSWAFSHEEASEQYTQNQELTLILEIAEQTRTGCRILSGKGYRRRFWNRLLQKNKPAIPSILKKHLGPFVPEAEGANKIALHLGCKDDAIIWYLLRKAWKVVVVEELPEMLRALRSRYAEQEKAAQLVLKHMDPDDFQPEGKVDLVIAMDFLPFISPLHLYEVSHRIYSYLLPTGFFIGNFFYSHPHASLQEERSQDAQETGAWFFSDPKLIFSSLQHLGWKIRQYQYERNPNLTHSVQFIAMKHLHLRHANPLSGPQQQAQLL